MADMLDKLKNAPVEVLCMSLTTPVIKKGRITCHGDGFCEVALDGNEAPLEGGTSVIVDAGPETGVRIKGQVVAVSGSRFRVESERLVLPDKRSFPRVMGGIRVRYRVVSGKGAKAAASAWLKGDDKPRAEGEWWEPDPFMDFSGSGLKFDDRLHCKVGDELLLQLQVPPGREVWRATARVVRLDPLPPPAQDELDEIQRELAPTHQIAIQFVELPPEASEALSAFTLRVQDALLASTGKPPLKKAT
jgi:hypothetical protein